MSININHILSAFQGSLHLNLRIMREIYGVRSFDVMPRVDGLLATMPQSTVRLNCDNAIAPYVMQAHCWQPEEFAFVQRSMGSGGAFTLIDIGANIGLFSRQCLARLGNCARSFVYEPDPGNVQLLRNNLADFANVIYRPVGLSDADGKLPFYLDPDNSGNYSLNVAAMPPEHNVHEVDCVDIRKEAVTWVATGLPLFYKSDTQGLDEGLMIRLDASFWKQVTAGIIEVWRIAKPGYDRALLASLLDGFANKCFLDQPAQPLSTANVMQFLEGSDGASHDLGFWR